MTALASQTNSPHNTPITASGRGLLYEEVAHTPKGIQDLSNLYWQETKEWGWVWILRD